VFVQTCGYFQHTGSPNPDTTYRSARVDDAGTYRLTGERGTAWQVTITPFDDSMRSSEPYDLSEVAHGPDGRFDVIVSRRRPPGHDGDWWPLEPGTTSLWLRAVSDRWGEETEPRVAITRTDAGRRSRPSPESIARRLGAVAPTVERMVAYGVRHVDDLRAAGFVNRLRLVDYASSGGIPRQSYHEGIFELADDEALVVEAFLPAGCSYFSWSMTDRLLVTLDWMNAHTSLNRSQATVGDGVLRVVVSGTDPGVRNWLDTAGHPTGVLQCRHAGSEQPPVVTAAVVPLASLFAHLPEPVERMTPAQRREAVQRRRIGAQLRCQW
jgi:hypothetical protein